MSKGKSFDMLVAFLSYQKKQKNSSIMVSLLLLL